MFVSQEMDELQALNARNVKLVDEIMALKQDNQNLSQISVSTHTFVPVKRRGRPPKDSKASIKPVGPSEVIITLKTQDMEFPMSFTQAWEDLEQKGNIFRTKFPDTTYEDLEDDIVRIEFLEPHYRKITMRYWKKALIASYKVLQKCHESIKEKAAWHNKIETMLGALAQDEDTETDNEMVAETTTKSRKRKLDEVTENETVFKFKRTNFNVSFSDFAMNVNQNTTWKDLEAFMTLVKSCF